MLRCRRRARPFRLRAVARLSSRSLRATEMPSHAGPISSGVEEAQDHQGLDRPEAAGNGQPPRVEASQEAHRLHPPEALRGRPGPARARSRPSAADRARWAQLGRSSPWRCSSAVIGFRFNRRLRRQVVWVGLAPALGSLGLLGPDRHQAAPEGFASRRAIIAPRLPKKKQAPRGFSGLETNGVPDREGKSIPTRQKDFPKTEKSFTLWLRASVWAESGASPLAALGRSGGTDLAAGAARRSDRVRVGDLSMACEGSCAQRSATG